MMAAMPTTEELNLAGYLVPGQAEAILCGVLTAHDGENALDRVDWRGLGVTSTTAARWWQRIQMESEERHALEEQKRVAIEESERAELERLKAKYDPPE